MSFTDQQIQDLYDSIRCARRVTNDLLSDPDTSQDLREHLKERAYRLMALAVTVSNLSPNMVCGKIVA